MEIDKQISQERSIARGVVVKRLTHEMAKERAAVAKIHTDELPDSELTVLGEAFLYRFYYGSLLKNPRYFCYICSVDGEVAGFTAFSTDSGDVCRGTVLRSWPGLTWTVVARMIRRPFVIFAIFPFISALLSAKRGPCAEIKAEAMSTAVARPYRSVDYFHRTGVNVAQALYLTIARVLHDLGVNQVKGYTRKTNVLVNTSLIFLGWKKVFTAERSFLWVWDTEAAVSKFNLTVI